MQMRSINFSPNAKMFALKYFNVLWSAVRKNSNCGAITRSDECAYPASTVEKSFECLPSIRRIVAHFESDVFASDNIYDFPQRMEPAATKIKRMKEDAL